MNLERRQNSGELRTPRMGPALNDYAGTIPAYSFAKPTAIAGDMFTVTRPDADNLSNVVVVLPASIAEDGHGLCSANWPLPVKYSGAAPAAGDTCGVAANSFELSTSKSGFKILAVDEMNSIAWVVPAAGSSSSSGSTKAWDVGDLKTALRVDDHVVESVVGQYYSEWKLLDGRTIGDSASGADWASADASGLFVFLWDHCPDLTVSGGRGATAAADWAAHKTLTIPNTGGQGYATGLYLIGGASVADGKPRPGHISGRDQATPDVTVASGTTGISVDAPGPAGAYGYVEDESSTNYPAAAWAACSVTDTGHGHNASADAINLDPLALRVGIFVCSRSALKT